MFIFNSQSKSITCIMNCFKIDRLNHNLKSIIDKKNEIYFRKSTMFHISIDHFLFHFANLTRSNADNSNILKMYMIHRLNR